MEWASRQKIAATESDLKNNRLGLMSQAQVRALQSEITRFQARSGQVLQRGLTLAVLLTIAVVALAFVRVLLLPIAMLIELLIVGGMIYLSADVNRFLQRLAFDCESATVRIVRGRASAAILPAHPLYATLRVEVQTYKLLSGALARQFESGELYQLYVLPQSGVIIAAEKISEKGARFLA